MSQSYHELRETNKYYSPQLIFNASKPCVNQVVLGVGYASICCVMSDFTACLLAD